MGRYRQLTRADRIQISVCLDRKMNLAEISRVVGFSKSTISRELRRNGRERVYWPGLAQDQHEKRVREVIKARPGTVRAETKRWIRERLEERWSPQQIAGRSAINGPQRVSHEYVYQFILQDKRSGGSLHCYLRRYGRPRHRFKGKTPRVRIRDRVDISTRPKIVELRKRLGDLEGDLIVGRGSHAHLVVLTDRVSKLVKIEKVGRRNSDDVAQSLIRLISRSARPKTLTVDNGLEFAKHKRVAEATGVPIYFARAYAAWQRGTIENTNGLIRQYVPKRSDIRDLSAKQVKEIERALNNRPRKCLKYLTPIERDRHGRVDQKSNRR